MRRFTACLLALILLASVSCCAAAEKDILLTEFNCKDLDGKDVDITLLDGADLLLVDIWEPWCGWCLKEMPDLNELYELNKDRGFLIVGLSGISSAPGYDAKETAEQLGITYPLVKGTKKMLPVDLEGFPTTLVYQRQEDGNLLLADVIVGYMPREDWEKLIEKYLPKISL